MPSVRLRREATDSSDESVFLDVFANNGTEVVVLEKTVTNNGTDFYLVVVKDGRSREKGFVKSAVHSATRARGPRGGGRQ